MHIVTDRYLTLRDIRRHKINLSSKINKQNKTTTVIVNYEQKNAKKLIENMNNNIIT